MPVWEVSRKDESDWALVASTHSEMVAEWYVDEPVREVGGKAIWLRDTMLGDVLYLPTSRFLAIPCTSSERREYLPIAWLEPPVITSNATHVLLAASDADFALLASGMHMTWLRGIGGRLKSDYRYSAKVVYNTFPIPPEYHTPETQTKLGVLARKVVNARAEWPKATPANLYDPVLTPPNLRQAHHDLDSAVDRLYRPTPFKSQSQRLQYLLELHQQQTRELT